MSSVRVRSLSRAVLHRFLTPKGRSDSPEMLPRTRSKADAGEPGAGDDNRGTTMARRAGAKQSLLRLAYALMTAAALTAGPIAGGFVPANAQNYDGDLIVRFGAFGQGALLHWNNTLPAKTTATGSGLTGGLVVGLDYHPSPYWLLGVEIDASLGDARGSVNGIGYGFDYMAALRGRFGVYPQKDWLLYGTAGFAYLGFEAQNHISGTKASETVPGLLVGLGVEYNWSHVILFGEYDYANFSSRQYTISNIRRESEVDTHMLRFGIKFKVGHDYERLGRHYDPD